MKFAICNETFVGWPFDKAFSFARKCGYTGIEIAPFTIDKDAAAISAQQRATVRGLAESEGLEVVGLHWLLAKTEGFYLTSPEAEVRERTSRYFEALAKLCRDLGGTIMVLGSPQQRNLLPGVSLEQAHEYAAETLRAAMPTIEGCGVTLALEPLGPAEGDFLRTAAEGEQLMARIDSPNCRLHLDVKAMSSESLPVAEVIRNHGANMAHFHANDPNKQGPGFGDVDFVPIFAALEDIGYDGWVSVEVFDYSPGVEVLANKSIEYMKKCTE